MLTGDEIVKKLYEQPEIFKHYMRRKEYQKAYMVRNDAGTVALFISLPEEKMDELFGSRQDLDNIKKGLFNEEQCMQAEKWVVFHDKGYQSITYEDVMNILWQKN